MKTLNTYLAYVVLGIGISLFIQCSPATKTVQTDRNAYSEACEGVTSLSWQKQIQTGDAETDVQRALDLVTALEADAKKSEDLKASGEFDGAYSSKLAQAINQNVSAGQEVDEDFWEQSASFATAACFVQSMLDREDLSESARRDIEDAAVRALNAMIMYESNSGDK